MELAREAAKTDKAFVLCLSAPFIPQHFKAQVDETAPYWDYVIGNETEAMAYAKAHDLSLEAADICLHLANLPKTNEKRKRVAIVTQGTDPTLVAVQGDDNVQEFPVHAVRKDEISDTSGAGDAFAGGLLAAIVQGRDLATSIDMGQWLAKLSIQQFGPS